MSISPCGVQESASPSCRGLWLLVSGIGFIPGKKFELTGKALDSLQIDNRIQNSLLENRLTQFRVNCNCFLMNVADFHADFYRQFLYPDSGAVIRITSRLVHDGRGSCKDLEGPEV